MHIPLRVELNEYDAEGLFHYYELFVTIPRVASSDTKSLVAREPDGDLRIVEVYEGGFGLDVNLRDQFLIAVFNHVFRRMKGGSGTGMDYWTTSIRSVLAKELGDDEVSEVIRKLKRYVTPESLIFEFSVCRLSKERFGGYGLLSHEDEADEEA